MASGSDKDNADNLLSDIDDNEITFLAAIFNIQRTPQCQNVASIMESTSKGKSQASSSNKDKEPMVFAKQTEPMVKDVQYVNSFAELIGNQVPTMPRRMQEAPQYGQVITNANQNFNNVLPANILPSPTTTNMGSNALASLALNGDSKSEGNTDLHLMVIDESPIPIVVLSPDIPLAEASHAMEIVVAQQPTHNYGTRKRGVQTEHYFDWDSTDDDVEREHKKKKYKKSTKRRKNNKRK
ncbi:hypothetical protein ACFE04_025454 [Oxalis oulophora]